MNALSQWANGIDLDRILEWVMFALAALLAISVHESAHALSAYWLGDDTAKRMKRISLNPLRHLDPFGFVMMIVAHFGWAKPVPVNPYRMTKLKSPKSGMALTAAAGPMANVLLALIFGLLMEVFGIICIEKSRAGEILSKHFLYYVYQFFAVNFVLNTGLAVFNLIPISPLDGSKILAIFLPDKAHRWLMQYERYGFLVLMGLLFLGVLDVPLNFLRGGLIRGIYALTLPIARLLTGTELPSSLLREVFEYSVGL